MFRDYLIVAAIIAAGIIFSIVFKKLTVAAAVAGGITGALLFAATGYSGIALMTAFFILASAATSWKINRKQQLGLAEKNTHGRTIMQVIANSGIPAILALLIIFIPQQKNVLHLMIAGAFASATADTVSSELGNLYGKNYYNILTLRKDLRGLDGVVSIEGTLFGFWGTVIIAVLYLVINKTAMTELISVIVAGTAGNLADSLLGATAERKGMINNDAVNLLNTFIAALVAMTIYLLIN